MATDLKGEGPHEATGSESLDYMIELTAELGQMARRAGFARLGLVFSLAEQEARLQMCKIADDHPRK